MTDTERAREGREDGGYDEALDALEQAGEKLARAQEEYDAAAVVYDAWVAENMADCRENHLPGDCWHCAGQSKK